MTLHRSSAELPQDLPRKGPGSESIRIDAGDPDLACAKFLSVSSDHLLVESEAGGAAFLHLDAHLELVVEPRRTAEVQVRIHHHELHRVMVAQHVLLEPEAAQPLAAGPLHEAEIVGVVHHTSQIRVLVIDAHLPGEQLRPAHFTGYVGGTVGSVTYRTFPALHSS